MRILITSGGTTVPIDPVRHISNMSTGRFGSQIARQALLAKNEVTYLVSSQGKSPFAYQADFYESPDLEHHLDHIQELGAFSYQYRAHYHEYRYHHFNEYAHLLKKLCEKEKPDIIILAAAVSDYLVSNYSDEKIRSKENLTLHFETAPKLIHSVKEWSPTSFVVGFKLLVNVSDEELVNAAMKSLMEHKLDLVVANDLASIKSGNHEIMIVERDSSSKKYTDNLAQHVIKRVLKK